jgi:hypothetical protein
MLRNYLKISVSGVPVYLYHEHMDTLKPYLSTENQFSSFQELLVYCSGHGITLSFEMPPKEESRKIHRNMLKLMKEYPETIMPVDRVRHFIESVAAETEAEDYHVWVEQA